MAALAGNPAVTHIEPDGKVYATDSELDNAWGVKRIGAGVVHAPPNSNTGLDVKVAIIDTGIDYTHPDLDGNYAGGKDFVNNDDDPMDDHGHGTHVAGTIGAEDNDAGVVGVAPGARLYALKILDSSGSGNDSDLIAAMEWAVDQSIQVVNLSLGTPTDPGLLVKEAFDDAAASGIVTVAAAGNSDIFGLIGNTVEWPARYASVIAVGATNRSDSLAYFSSTVTLEVEDSRQFTATGIDQYGDPIDTGTITWQVGDSGVGTIDATGLFTAAAAGSTTVTATAGGVSGTASITVEAAPVVSIMHVGDIALTWETRLRGKSELFRITATVHIQDAAEAGVDQAGVNGEWSGAYNTRVSGTTASDGTVRFTTDWVRIKKIGAFTFTVTDVQKADWLYNPSANVETSDSLIVK